jgi:EmrB/QacA subfamily drug resistance transporter
VAPALGPILGGILVTTLSWRWVFFVNLPVGIIAFAFGLLFLDGGTEHRPGRFDTVGFVLAGLGFGSLMYGVSEGPIRGWAAPIVSSTIVAGSILIAALVVVELQKAQPIIDLRLFANRLFGSCNGVILLTTATFVGTLFSVTLFFQDGRGLSALTSGLSVFPEAIGVMLGAQVATRVLYPRFGPRRHVCAGLAMMATSAALMALVGQGTSLWLMRALMFCLGVSMAGVIVPVQAAAFATVSPAATGRASTMFNANRQLGGAIGVAIFTSTIVAVGVFHKVAGHETPSLAGYHAAFLVAGAIALCALPVALTISDLEAAATVVRRPRRGRTATIPAPDPAEGAVT